MADCKDKAQRTDSATGFRQAAHGDDLSKDVAFMMILKRTGPEKGITTGSGSGLQGVILGQLGAFKGTCAMFEAIL